MKYAFVLVVSSLLVPSTIAVPGKDKVKADLHAAEKFAEVHVLPQDITGTAASAWPKPTGHHHEHHKKLLDKYQKFSDTASKAIGAKSHNHFSGEGLCNEKHPCMTITNASTAHIDAEIDKPINHIGEKQISGLLDQITKDKETKLEEDIHKGFLFGHESKSDGVVARVIAPKEKMSSEELAGYLFDSWKLMATDKKPTAIRAVKAQTDGKPVELMSFCLYPDNSDKDEAKNFCLGRDDASKMPKKDEKKKDDKKDDKTKVDKNNDKKKKNDKKKDDKKKDGKDNNGEKDKDDSKEKDEKKEMEGTEDDMKADEDKNEKREAVAEADAEATNFGRIGILQTQGMGNTQLGRMGEAPTAPLLQREAAADALDNHNANHKASQKREADPSWFSFLEKAGKGLFKETPELISSVGGVANQAKANHNTKKAQQQQQQQQKQQGGKRSAIAEAEAEILQKREALADALATANPDIWATLKRDPNASPRRSKKSRPANPQGAPRKSSGFGNTLNHLGPSIIEQGPELLSGGAQVMQATQGFKQPAPARRGITKRDADPSPKRSKKSGPANPAKPQGSSRKNSGFGKTVNNLGPSIIENGAGLLSGGAEVMQAAQGFRQPAPAQDTSAAPGTARRGLSRRDANPAPRRFKKSKPANPQAPPRKNSGGGRTSTNFRTSVIENGGDILSGGAEVVQAVQGFQQPAPSRRGLAKRELLRRELAARDIEFLAARDPNVKTFINDIGDMLSNVVKRDGTEISARDIQRAISDPSFKSFFKERGNYINRDGTEISTRDLLRIARNPAIQALSKKSAIGTFIKRAQMGEGGLSEHHIRGLASQIVSNAQQQRKKSRKHGHKKHGHKKHGHGTHFQEGEVGRKATEMVSAAVDGASQVGTPVHLPAGAPPTGAGASGPEAASKPQKEAPLLSRSDNSTIKVEKRGEPKPESNICKTGSQIPLFGALIDSGCKVVRSLSSLM